MHVLEGGSGEAEKFKVKVLAVPLKAPSLPPQPVGLPASSRPRLIDAPLHLCLHLCATSFLSSKDSVIGFRAHQIQDDLISGSLTNYICII